MLLTPESLAERWQVSPALIRKMLAKGDLPGFRLGGKLWRIDKVMECAAAETVCDFWLVPFRWDERPPKIVKFAFTDAAREDAKATIREFYADERNWRYL